MKHELTFIVNGAPLTVWIDPWARLIDVLRDEIGLTGTKEGCSQGECGACTVLVDDRAVNACLFPALEAEGRRVLTVEGLRRPDNSLSAVQQAFVDRAGTQCGFCTPGMIMSTVALLAETLTPTDADIHRALAGNLCRCTGYVQIIDSIRHAADTLRAEREREGTAS